MPRYVDQEAKERQREIGKRTWACGIYLGTDPCLFLKGSLDRLAKFQRKWKKEYIKGIQIVGGTVNYSLISRENEQKNISGVLRDIVWIRNYVLDTIVPCHATLIKNQRNYYKYAFSEPTDMAIQILACRHTSLDDL